MSNNASSHLSSPSPHTHRSHQVQRCSHNLPKTPNPHDDLHNQWIGVHGFDFPFNEPLDTNATPVALKLDVIKIIMTKIVNHIMNKAVHTDLAKMPDVKQTLKDLCLTLLHDSL